MADAFLGRLRTVLRWMLPAALAAVLRDETGRLLDAAGRWTLPAALAAALLPSWTLFLSGGMPGAAGWVLLVGAGALLAPPSLLALIVHAIRRRRFSRPMLATLVLGLAALGPPLWVLNETAGAGAAGASATPVGAGDDLQAALEARVAQLRADTGLTAVGAAVAVDGRLAATAAAGERRRRSGIPVTVADRWHVGSVTKSMTATLLAALEEDGLLTADDLLPALLPDVEMAAGWRACALHHLLTHTAGARANLPLRYWSVWPDTAAELAAERRRAVAAMLAEEPESPCGERYAYSNVGYTVAGHVAETVAGAPYETLMRNRVFAPLALTSAGFGPPRGARPDQEPVGHFVRFHRRFPVDPFEGPADNTPLMAPAGTVHMTVGDLARYGAAHLAGEQGAEPALLAPSSWRRLHAPFRDDYARGWVRYELDWAGGSVIWHNGSNTYWSALLMLLPARNMTLAFVTNDGAPRAADAAFVALARELSGMEDRAAAERVSYTGLHGDGQ